MQLAADLDTPAVTILLDRLEANISRAPAHGFGGWQAEPPAHQDAQDP